MNCNSWERNPYYENLNFASRIFGLFQKKSIRTLTDSHVSNPPPQQKKQLANGSAVNFDSVVMKFFINNRTEMHKKLMSKMYLFYSITRPQNGQMPGKNEGKIHCKLALNTDWWMMFEITWIVPIPFIAFWLHLKKAMKSHWLKGCLESWTSGLIWIKFSPSLLLLMIKMSQSACKKLDSYCKTLLIT